MKIAIYSQYQKNKSLDSFIKLLEVLNKKAFRVFVEDEFYTKVNRNSFLELDTFTALDNSYDLLISVGGDGTILRAVTFLKDLDIPLIGVNTGRLGFLATIQANEIQDAIDAILNKNYNKNLKSYANQGVIPLFKQSERGVDCEAGRGVQKLESHLLHHVRS